MRERPAGLIGEAPLRLALQPRGCVRPRCRSGPDVGLPGVDPHLQNTTPANAIRAGGCTYADACLKVGISTSVFQLWKKKGKEQKKGRFSELLDELEEAEAGFRATRLQRLVYPQFALRGDRRRPRRTNDGKAWPKALPRCGMRNHPSKWETRRWRKLRLKVFELDGHRCRCCGKALECSPGP